jgi:predicted MFS family arabinose efflux permease
MISSVEIPSRQSLVIELAGREDLPQAIALNSSGFNLARIVGPAVGAVVIRTAGLPWCFALNALSYAAVLVGLFMMRLPAYSQPIFVGSRAQALAEGLRFMVRDRRIRVLMTLVTAFSICGVPYLALMPVIARDILHTGASGYGSLLTAVGIGGLGGALFLASVGSRVRRGQLLAVGSFAYGSLLLVFSQARSLHIAWPLLLFVGCAMIFNGALSNAMLQELVPDQFRGRLMSAYSLVVVGLSQVIGNFLAGIVARAFNADYAVAIGATVMLGFAWWAFARHPDLRSL